MKLQVAEDRYQIKGRRWLGEGVHRTDVDIQSVQLFGFVARYRRRLYSSYSSGWETLAKSVKQKAGSAANVQDRKWPIEVKLGVIGQCRNEFAANTINHFLMLNAMISIHIARFVRRIDAFGKRTLEGLWICLQILCVVGLRQRQCGLFRKKLRWVLEDQATAAFQKTPNTRMLHVRNGFASTDHTVLTSNGLATNSILMNGHSKFLTHRNRRLFALAKAADHQRVKGFGWQASDVAIQE